MECSASEVFLFAESSWFILLFHWLKSYVTDEFAKFGSLQTVSWKENIEIGDFHICTATQHKTKIESNV